MNYNTNKTIIEGNTFRLISSMGAFELVYNGITCPFTGFSKYSEGVYVKPMNFEELDNAYYVAAYAIYRGFLFQVDKEENDLIRLNTSDDEAYHRLGLNFVDRGWYDIWVKPTQIDKMWEERSPSQFDLPLPKGLTLKEDIDINKLYSQSEKSTLDKTFNSQVSKVIQSGELFEFLIGLGDYALPNPLADMPTDDIKVFDLMKEYYNNTKDEKLWAIFENALERLSNEKEYIFMLPLYVYSYVLYNRNTGFGNVNLNRISAVFSDSFRNNTDFLENYIAWSAKNMKGGMIGYIRYMVDLIRDEYGVNLLKGSNNP